MATVIQHISISALLEASRAFGGVVPDGTVLAPRDLPRVGGRFDGGPAACAAVISDGQAVDGNHRCAGLVAWAGDDVEALGTLVPVIVTDDVELVRAILAAKDAGQNDVDDLILAAWRAA